MHVVVAVNIDNSGGLLPAQFQGPPATIPAPTKSLE